MNAEVLGSEPNSTVDQENPNVKLSEHLLGLGGDLLGNLASLTDLPFKM